MSDLLQRAREARALANDQSLPNWQRLTQALQSFAGLQLTGLPRDVRMTLEAAFVSVNQVLAKYQLQSTEDYESIREADLQRMLDIVDSLAARLTTSY